MTHTFNLNGRAIRIIVSHHGKKYKKATGLLIDPKLWNTKAKSLGAKCQDRSVWAKLRAIHLRMQEKEGEDGRFDEQRILAAIDYAINGEKPAESPKNDQETKNPTFYEYFEEYASRDTPQQRQRKNSLKLIRDCMGDRHDWNDIDTAFYFRLIQKLKDKDYSVNYIGSVIKKLKTVMSEGYKLKYHTNTDYHDFKSPTEEASTVWLTPKEVDMLASVELTDTYEIMARDLFLLGYKTAMRYSDYSRLTLDNIRDNKIYISQKKTAGGVVIPASPVVIKILKKYGGRAPQMHQMVFNRKIKTVGMRAKINEKVLVVKSKGDRHEQEFVEKWTQLSSHCCRRSALSTLHLSGLPLHQLMMISGHKDIQSLQRYLRMTKEENAQALKSNPFFK